jgi:hypothetical protein
MIPRLVGYLSSLGPGERVTYTVVARALYGRRVDEGEVKAARQVVYRAVKAGVPIKFERGPQGTPVKMWLEGDTPA